MVSVRGLSVRYGRSVRALDAVDIEMAADGVLAVLGGNGAGKSTLLRAVSGTLGRHGGSLTAGEIVFQDRRTDRLNAGRVVRAGIALVPQDRQLFTRMTVAENLRAGAMGARSRAARRAARDRVQELFPALAEWAEQPAGLLPGAEQRLLAIARALMSDPKLLLIDEPSLGVPAAVLGQIAHVVREIHQRGTAVLLVEQDPALALQVADHVVVLDGGRVVRSAPAAGWPARPRPSPGPRPRPVAEPVSPRRPIRTLSRWAG